MQYISHGAYLSTCACVAWTRTPTTRGRPNCFVLDMPLCWRKMLYSTMFRLRGSRLEPQQPDSGGSPMATVAADIQENWIQDFANWINSKTASSYEAVAITGLSQTTVRKRIRQKRIRAVRRAGNWRIVRADLAGLQ